MPQLLTGPEFLEVLAKYESQKSVNDGITKMIILDGRDYGQIRTPVEVVDNHTFLGVPSMLKKPTRYFDVAFDFRWIRGRKIVKPGQMPEQDRLSIGIIAAEEYTKEQFGQKMEDMAAEDIMRAAAKLINQKPTENDNT